MGEMFRRRQSQRQGYLEMCRSKKSGWRVRWIDQLAFEASGMRKPSLPVAIGGFSGKAEWVGKRGLDALAAKATRTPFDLLFVSRHSASLSARQDEYCASTFSDCDLKFYNMLPT
jgi:hypothetical protein